MASFNGEKHELTNYEMRVLMNLSEAYDPDKKVTPAGLAVIINERKPHKTNKFNIFFKCKNSLVEERFRPGLVIEGYDIREARELEHYYSEKRKELREHRK